MTQDAGEDVDRYSRPIGCKKLIYVHPEGCVDITEAANPFAAGDKDELVHICADEWMPLVQAVAELNRLRNVEMKRT